jgi:hypothetical protein
LQEETNVASADLSSLIHDRSARGPQQNFGVVRKALFLGDTDEGRHPAR